MFNKAYEGKRVLVTGHTGFKGSWLATWLLNLGAEVAGFASDIPTSPSNFEVLGLGKRLDHRVGDVRDRAAFQSVLARVKPDVVFHLAAQALVQTSYRQPATTFETNTLGTMNVLESLRMDDNVKAAVIITSDKCYQNAEWTWGYRENDHLGGDDPYSASKGAAEIVARAYYHSFFRKSGPAMVTTRAGNVVGGGDWALDRIIPDTIRAWSEDRPVQIRNPHSTRPWQHVLEPLSGYLHVGAKLLEGEETMNGEAFNFGPDSKVNQTVEDVVNELRKHWPDADLEIDTKARKVKKEQSLLKLSCDKALNLLDWHATLDFEETIRFTGLWYKSYYDKQESSMYDFTQGQLGEYISLAGSRGLSWTK
ncbi:CDP-glucose 4,6-dehydratase [Fibrobacterota bacterium]